MAKAIDKGMTFSVELLEKFKDVGSTES
jgi:hypothetical protein